MVEDVLGMKSNNVSDWKTNRKTKRKTHLTTSVPFQPQHFFQILLFPALSFSVCQLLSFLPARPSLTFCPGVKQVRCHAVCVSSLQGNI